MPPAKKLDANVEHTLGGLIEQYNDAAKRESLDLWYKTPNSKQNPLGPYGWQVEFHNAGKENTQRAIIAGNQTGKS